MNIAKIETIAILILSTILLQSTTQEIIANACIEFQAGLCTRCKRETHLFQGICYRNILGCVRYRNGSQCDTCEQPNFKLVDNYCAITVSGVSESQLKNQLYKYSGQSQYNPGDQYGQSSFIPSSFQSVSSWPTFVALDNYIRRGQYGHYISRMSNPVYSVHYYQTKDTYSYKLLYHGSGGGLFLCIADVPPGLKVGLRSLTPISASNVVYNCYDYDISGKCMGCVEGYHLQSGKCYLNYGGCVKYLDNICTKCMDYYLLVENRCTSDCLSASDSRSIFYYQSNKNKSTLQLYYGTNINNFYTISITTTTTKITTFTNSLQLGQGLKPQATQQIIGQTYPQSLSLNLTKAQKTENTSFGGQTKNQTLIKLQPLDMKMTQGGSQMPQMQISTAVSTPTLHASAINWNISTTKQALSIPTKQIQLKTVTNYTVTKNIDNTAGISQLFNLSNTTQSKNISLGSASNVTIGQLLATTASTNSNQLATNAIANSQVIDATKVSGIKINSSIPTMNTLGFNDLKIVISPTQQMTTEYENRTIQYGSNMPLPQIPPNPPIQLQQLHQLQAPTPSYPPTSLPEQRQSGQHDPNCLKINNNNRNQCLRCVQFFFVNDDGICDEISPLCVALDQNGRCTRCFYGYMLNRGYCDFKMQ